MADDDLTLIPGLLDKHRKVLSAQLKVTTSQALAQADPHAIFDAMFRIRPRPTVTEIRGWQQHAGRVRDRAIVEAPNWDRVATFVLSFEQRDAGDGSERRLVVEQTELEPEQPASSWAAWDCSELCDWLQGRVGATEPAEQIAMTPLAVETVAVRAGAGQRQLRIEQVAVVDAGGRVDVVTDGRLTAEALVCSGPCRLELTVAGANAGHEVGVALRFSRRGQPGWSPHEPVTVLAGEPAELALADITAGEHDARLVAWTADASSLPVTMALGRLTIRPTDQCL